jgi:predicted peroxiredoxin
MAPRPPLALLLTVADPARLRAALMLALCELALGGTARLFVFGAAAGLLAAPVTSPEDDATRAAGEPALAELLDEALDASVPITACQSGLAIAQARADALDPRIAIGGLIGFLAAMAPQDRLLTL